MNLVSLSAVALSAGVAFASPTVVQSFDLFNHHSTGLGTDVLGLRFDSFPDGNGEDPMAFSFENATGESAVRLDIVEDNGQTNIVISGKIRGNSIGGTDYGIFDLTLVYNDVDAVSNGFEFREVAMVGTISETAGTTAAGQIAGDSFTFSSKRRSGVAFRFNNLGSASNPSWEGHGWFMPNTGNFGNNTYDTHFTAVVVPLPTASGLGLGGLCVVAARRRTR